MATPVSNAEEALVPVALKRFLRRRLMEVAGLSLLATAGLLTLALASWSITDPSLDRAVEGEIHNWLGWPGAVVADLMLAQLGLAALVPVAVLVIWGVRWLAFRPVAKPHYRLVWLVAAVLAASGFLAALPTPESWALGTGLGGNAGDALLDAFSRLFGLFMQPLAAHLLAAALLGISALFTFFRATDITGDSVVRVAGILGERSQDKVAQGVGAVGHWHLRLKGLIVRRNRRDEHAARRNAEDRETATADSSATEPTAPVIRRPQPAVGTVTAMAEEDDDRPPVAAFAPRARRQGGALLAKVRGLLGGILGGLREKAWRMPLSLPSPASAAAGDIMEKREPVLAGVPSPTRAEPAVAPADMAVPEAPVPQSPAGESGEEAAPWADEEPIGADAATAGGVTIGGPVDSAFLPEELAEEPEAGEAPTAAAPARDAAATAPAKPATKPAPKARPKPGRPIKLPPLDILATPDPSKRQAAMSDEELQANAQTLQQVLEDFGVRGQIVNVCPGPVVTLYEFEPAPGVKSSRVIGLADDIARSMCAVSARIAVVPGRNVIGIELPNEKREMVFLREMLESKGYRKSKFNLPLALGKNIAGEPVFADLARMPHLLIAGTTGSGKSVGINTFIMSLLYRHTPETCRLIMIDPKMLELSIYDGIPHLLTPVVTDPRKAVVALKWAVREMEERYQKMAMMGVRNLDGFNARVKEALKKGEKITRTVQTGFDPNTGEPVFEEEELDLSPLPYIVVIIDEMADLMMVAGKDIEGAVQRLAQMARAAGIHVIMATQRPSVDVITGTIKANFPTRISFQVTSKIDSRTILGEQGAEQLLGQGDMLYMAGGGRIVRLHGPFVSDEEVEQVVNNLKRQAPPEYVDAVTSEQEEGGSSGGAGAGGKVGASGDELYDRAVQVVLRDRKVSTSYIQRRLQIGYNKAATLIERMEEEGLISAPNSKGRREILVGGDSAQD